MYLFMMSGVVGFLSMIPGVGQAAKAAWATNALVTTTTSIASTSAMVMTTVATATIHAFNQYKEEDRARLQIGINEIMSHWYVSRDPQDQKRKSSTLHRLGEMTAYAENFTMKAFGSSETAQNVDLWEFVEQTKPGVKKQQGQADCKSGPCFANLCSNSQWSLSQLTKQQGKRW
jgi:hypothetical protein